MIDEAAKSAGTTPKSIEAARALEHKDPEQLEAVKKGKPIIKAERKNRPGMIYLLFAGMPPRPYHRPSANLLSDPEREVLGWMQLGSGLHAATTLADVNLCDALRWAEDGERHPNGFHSRFTAELKALGYRPAEPVREVRLGKAAKGYGQHGGYHQNGNGSGRNGAQRLVRFEDL